MTPRELAEEAADKSWGIAESGKGMMQDAVEAALLAFAKAHAKEFRRLATEAVERSGRLTKEGNRTGALSAMGKAMTWRDAAEMLEEELNG